MFCAICKELLPIVLPQDGNFLPAVQVAQAHMHKRHGHEALPNHERLMDLLASLTGLSLMDYIICSSKEELAAKATATEGLLIHIVDSSAQLARVALRVQIVESDDGTPVVDPVMQEPEE